MSSSLLLAMHTGVVCVTYTPLFSFYIAQQTSCWISSGPISRRTDGCSGECVVMLAQCVYVYVFVFVCMRMCLCVYVHMCVS